MKQRETANSPALDKGTDTVSAASTDVLRVATLNNFYFSFQYIIQQCEKSKKKKTQQLAGQVTKRGDTIFKPPLLSMSMMIHTVALQSMSGLFMFGNRRRYITSHRRRRHLACGSDNQAQGYLVQLYLRCRVKRLV